MKRFITFLLALFLMISITAFTVLHSSGISGYSGSPADGGATCASCHSRGTAPTVTISASPAFGAGNTTYAPSTTYTISVICTGDPKYGLNLEMLNGNTSSASDAGKFGAVVSSNCYIASTGPTTISHNQASTSGTFSFTWTSPASGTVYLYSCELGANGDGSTSGDLVKQTNLTLTPAAAVSLDAGVSAITTPSSLICSTTFSPVVTLKNFGSATLTSCTISYYYDSNPAQTYSWTGSLATGASVTVTLPSMTVTAGSHTFTSSASAPNGGVNGITTNNQSQSSFTSSSGSAASLPLLETFQTSTFPPSGWTMHFPSPGDSAWRLCTTTGYNSTQCMFFPANCGNSVNITGQRQQLYTPNYSFVGEKNPKMWFDVAYEPSSLPKYSDTLVIYYSLNCGSTWTSIYSKGGATLCTTGGTTSGKVDVNSSGCFVPPSSTAWRTDSINITALNNQPSVMFSFESRSGWGNIIYLDNINVTAIVSTSVDDPAATNSVKVFPNPFRQSFTVEYNLNKDEPVAVYLTDLLGKRVAVQASENEVSGPHSLEVDFGALGLAKGIYVLQVQTDSGNSFRKVIAE